MTPHEKAANAINRRLERLQANLPTTKSEVAQQFLFQSLVVTLGMSEAMTDYVKTVGEYAQRRHGEFKDTTATVGARHAGLLTTGQELLEQLKANPTDRTLRREIEVAQRAMEAIQKDLRRGAFSLQRELSLSMAMIDRLAETVRRLCEAEQAETLKRALQEFAELAGDLYVALKSALPAKDLVDAAAWEKSALAAVEPATDFHDAYARAGHQAMLALEAMILAVSANPPTTAEEVTRRAGESAAGRLKAITARFTAT